MADGRIIGIVSGKGGVGKTTVCVNLGIALRRFNASVTVVDADFSASNLGVHLGRYDHPVKIQKVLEGSSSPSSAIFRHPTGIKAITSSKEIYDVEPDVKDLRSVLEHAAEESDYVLVDCPPGLNSRIESIMTACDEMLIVTEPTQTSGINAAQIIEKCKQLQKPVLGTIVNKVEGKPEKELIEREIEMMTETHVMGKIPHDGKVKESLFEYTPLLDYHSLAEASLEIKDIASDIHGVEYERPKFAKFRRKIYEIKENIQK